MRLPFCLALLLTASCSSVLGLDEFTEARATAGAGGTAGNAGQSGSGGSSAGQAGTAGIGGANVGGSGASGGTSGIGGSGAAAGQSSGGTGGTSGAAGQTSYSIGELRLRPDGFVNGVLRNVYVTYVRSAGFYVQDRREGPAIYVYSPAGLPVAVGNQIDLEVLKVGTFANYRQLENTTVVMNDNGTYDVVTNLAQTISTGAGITLGEELESELVVVNQATVVEQTSVSVYTVEYGSGPTSAKFFVNGTTSLCVGASFDFVGIVVDWSTGPQLQSESDTDFSNLNTTACSN